MAASDDDSADPLRPSPAKRQRTRRNARKRDQKSELWFDAEAKAKLDAEVRIEFTEFVETQGPER